MHRLVVVDDDEKVIGIISLSDILLYLVLRPCGEDNSNGVTSVRAHTNSISKSISDSDLAEDMDHTIPEEDGDIGEDSCDDPPEERSRVEVYYNDNNIVLIQSKVRLKEGNKDSKKSPCQTDMDMSDKFYASWFMLHYF